MKNFEKCRVAAAEASERCAVQTMRAKTSPGVQMSFYLFIRQQTQFGDGKAVFGKPGLKVWNDFKKKVVSVAGMGRK